MSGRLNFEADLPARVRRRILHRIPDIRSLSRTHFSLSPSAPVAIGGACLSFAARAAGSSRSGTSSCSILPASATTLRCCCGLQGFPRANCGSGIWSARGASRSTMQRCSLWCILSVPGGGADRISTTTQGSEAGGYRPQCDAHDRLGHAVQWCQPANLYQINCRSRSRERHRPQFWMCRAVPRPMLRQRRPRSSIRRLQGGRIPS